MARSAKPSAGVHGNATAAHPFWVGSGRLSPAALSCCRVDRDWASLARQPGVSRITTFKVASVRKAARSTRVATGANTSTWMGCHRITQPVIAKPASKVLRSSRHIHSVESLATRAEGGLLSRQHMRQQVGSLKRLVHVQQAEQGINAANAASFQRTPRKRVHPRGVEEARDVVQREFKFQRCSRFRRCSD